MGIGKRSLFTNQRDVGMREDGLDAIPQLKHYLSHTFTSLSKSGCMDIGLRGYTADIKTGTAHLASLKDYDFQALLGGIFSGAVSSRSRADDNQISCCHSSFAYKW